MGREATATLNYQLTNFATGKWNDMQTQEAQQLSRRLCPVVAVPGNTGQYKEFNDINAFQLYNTARALGGNPTRMEFKASDASYNAKPNALEITIDEKEYNDVGGDRGSVGAQLLREGKVSALTGAAARSDAFDTVQFVLANTTPVAGRGDWFDPNVDPIDQIDEQLDALSLAVGARAGIKIDLDVTAWRVLRSNKKVKERINPTQPTPITLDQLNANLLFPVDLNVANVVYHTTKLGQASQAKARLLASICLIHFSVENPTIYDPSAFKRFSVGLGSPVAAVRSYESENGLWEGHFLDWSLDRKQTSTVAMRRLAIAAAPSP